MRLLITSILTLCIVSSTHGTKVIIVHGSFATNEPWYKPGGDFFEAVNEQASAYNFTTESFSWSGIPDYQNILDGAKKLAHSINKNLGERHILIGHSHGGNVILLASQLLNTVPPETIPVLVPATTHFLYRELRVNKPLDEYKKIIRTLSESFSSWQPLQWFFKKDRTKKQASLKYPVTHIFLLGTPLITALFSPAMHQVKTVWNLYSQADSVQSLGGICSKTLPQKNRMHNFEVSLKTTDHLFFSPSHCDLHHPVIGSWLINLAELLNPAAITNKKLWFSNDEPPNSLLPNTTTTTL